MINKILVYIFICMLASCGLSKTKQMVLPDRFGWQYRMDRENEYNGQSFSLSWSLR